MKSPRTLQSLAVAVCLSAGITMSNAAITIDLVNVGNAGNAGNVPAPMTGPYGAVSYDYAIGKYEVTIGQYTSFLNAVAATDTYSLYNANMGTDLQVAGISRTGSSGSFSYSVMTNSGSSANRPITYVSWFDAARFSNWMANGQGSGSTETGAYTLNGAMSGIVTRNDGAIWFIPSENEWYKAAYYSPGASTDSYWLYPTQSDSAPGNTIGSVINQANCYDGTHLSTGGEPYLTDVGAFSASPSFYGTFDQGGNVWEWNDAVIAGSSRELRGGSWAYDVGFPVAGLRSSYSRSDLPTSESNTVGFRIASVPEPTTAGLVLLAGAGWAVWKRRKITT